MVVVVGMVGDVVRSPVVGMMADVNFLIVDDALAAEMAERSVVGEKRSCSE